MRFALVQPRPEIRLYKLARGLVEHGHEVVVVSGGRSWPRSEHAWLAERFPHLSVESAAAVEAFAASMDVVVHVDRTTELALAARDHPGYVQFVGDLSGIREDADHDRELEGECLRAARGLLFVSPAQAECARDLYGPFACPVLAVHNGPVEEMLGDPRTVPKLSAGDGRIHVVYSGLVSRTSGGSRDVAPLVDSLLGDEALVVHVLGAAGKKLPDWLLASAEEGDRLVVEPTVASRDLVGSLARFDVGLVYVNEAFPRIRDTMRPNKLYEYVAAGLPVVANRGRALEEYLTARQAGLVFDRLAEVSRAVREALELARRPGWPPPVETYEDQATGLDAFFREVLAGTETTLS